MKGELKMPKKKKRVYSTKGRKVESEPTFDEIIDEESGLNESENESIDVQMVPKCHITLDEAIAWFTKNPHEEEFISLDKPGTAVCQGNHYIQFKNASLVTSDPAVVEILLRANAPGAKYGVHFVALNPVLRNFKK